MVAYRDADYIKASLRAVMDYVDEAVFCLGKHPYSLDLKDDGTKETILSECRVPFKIDEEPGMEFQLRNKLVEAVKDGDFLLMLDGDEACVGEVGKAIDKVKRREDVETWWVKVEEYDQFNHKNLLERRDALKPKLIRIHDGYRFRKNHWHLHDASGKLVTDWVISTVQYDYVKDFVIKNNGGERKGKYQENRQANIKFMESLAASGYDEEANAR